MTIEQLERAVTGLKPDDLDQFAKWFEEYLSDQWDKQIENDIRSGKLDGAGKRADEDFEAGMAGRAPPGSQASGQPV